MKVMIRSDLNWSKYIDISTESLRHVQVRDNNDLVLKDYCMNLSKTRQTNRIWHKVKFLAEYCWFEFISFVRGRLLYRAYICRCLPPDTTWHKVKSPKAD